MKHFKNYLLAIYCVRPSNTADIVDRRIAAKMLNAKAYSRYKLCRKRVSEYECMKVPSPSTPTPGQCETIIVKSTRYPDAPTCIFVSFKQRCSC